MQKLEYVVTAFNVDHIYCVRSVGGLDICGLIHASITICKWIYSEGAIKSLEQYFRVEKLLAL